MDIRCHGKNELAGTSIVSLFRSRREIWRLISQYYRELSSLSAKVEDYENLLKDISTYVDGRTADRVLATLNKVSTFSHMIVHRSTVLIQENSTMPVAISHHLSPTL